MPRSCPPHAAFPGFPGLYPGGRGGHDRTLKHTQGTGENGTGGVGTEEAGGGGGGDGRVRQLKHQPLQGLEHRIPDPHPVPTTRGAAKTTKYSVSGKK